MLPHLGTKLLCLYQWYFSPFAYTHAKFGRVEALLNGQARNGAVFKGLSLYLSLPVVVQLLHGITAVTEGSDQVSLDLAYYSVLNELK